MRPLLTALLIAACALSAAGCLTVEQKIYRVTLRPDHSGEAVITFVNIRSESDDTVDVTDEDFRQLIEFYLEGDQIERDNPGFRNVRKRLYEEDGVLKGDLTFEFDSLSAVRLFRYDRNSPLMYFAGSPLSSEQLVETNGTRGPDWMPVVFWDRGETELYIRTRVVSEVSYHRALLDRFRAWRSARPQGKP